MKTDNINQILAQIETNLSKLESARNQVEQVTKGNNDLTDATYQLAVEVKKIAVLVKSETLSVIDQFSQSLGLFEGKIQGSLTQGEKSIEDKVEKFELSAKRIQTISDSVISDVNALSSESLRKQESEMLKVINGIKTSFSEELAVIERNIDEITTESFQNIKGELERFKNTTSDIEVASNDAISNLQQLSVATIKKQHHEISQTIDAILSYSSNLQNLIDQLSAMNLADKLDSLSIAVSNLQEDNQGIRKTIQNTEDTFSKLIKELILNQKISSKRQKTHSYITWVIIIVSALSILIGSQIL